MVLHPPRHKNCPIQNMKQILLLFILVPLLGISQISTQKMQGEVFKAYGDFPMEDLRESSIVVHRSLYRITFEDPEIPKRYKKAVEDYFRYDYNGKRSTGKFELKVKKRQDEIYIEGKKMTPLDDEW